MKRVLLLCLIGIAALDVHAVASDPPQRIQPFSAVFWTTRTISSPAGKLSVFMQRTVYTRDSSGNVRSEIYRPTKGLVYDTTAPLDRVLTGHVSSQSQALPILQSGSETIAQETDLGSTQISGVAATGKRQGFQDATGQPTHTIETWFSKALGLTVRMENRDNHGNSTVTELSELHLGEPASPSAEAAPVASSPIPLLNLYRGLFAFIAHMERDRLANDPNLHVNMNDIEDHLRAKLGLSAGDWQLLVDKSVKVESYTRDMSQQARAFADQDRALRRQNPLGPNTLAAGRATLHRMQMDLNAHVQGEIDQLKAAVGPDATAGIEAYLKGPMTASAHIGHANVRAGGAQ